LLEQFPEFAADLEDVLVLPTGDLLAVGAAPGIFRSTDAGESWAPVTNPSSARLIDIEIASGATLFAIGEQGQVLRSTDQGVTWTLRTTPAPNDLREQYWFDAQSGYVVGNFLARRTTDGGQTWQQLVGFTENEPVNEVFFTDPQHGIILSDFHTWRSTNGGASWSGSQNFGLFVYPGNTIVLGPWHFIVATNLEGATILETTDGGQAWTPIFQGSLGGFLDFDRLSDGTLVAVTDDGDAYRSTDGGSTWVNATYTASDHQRGVIGGIGLGPGGRGAAGTTGSPVPTVHWYRTSDGGTTWLPVANAPSIVFTSEIEYWDADRAIAGGAVGRMWRTTDGGVSWSFAILPAAPTNASAYHVSLPAPGVAFAACSGQSQRMVFRTTDFGATWEARSNGIPLAGWITSVSFLDANRGFAAGFSGSSVPQLFKTTDGGGLWSPVGTAGLSGGPWDIHWFDEQTGLATVRNNPGGIFHTTNGGTSWQSVSNEPASELDFSDAMHGGALPSASNAGGVMLVTVNGGATWEELLLPTTRGGQALAALPDGFLVAGGASTIVRVERVGSTATPGEPAPAANGLALAARPKADGQIEVTFALADPGMAELAIVDVAGRRVATLARDEFPAGTSVIRTWNGRSASDRPAARGVYFVRLVSGGAARAAKIVVTR
jgi:photosystem II stability/assembly factor-like uncharacterized protein